MAQYIYELTTPTELEVTVNIYYGEPNFYITNEYYFDYSDVLKA